MYCCPLCLKQTIKSPIGILQHVDSGRCIACFSHERASDVLQKIVSECRPELCTPDSGTSCNNDSDSDEDPQLDYVCNLCHDRFSKISQLMQHKVSLT